MIQLIDWLKGHIPPDDSDPSAVRISHGDYRCASPSRPMLSGTAEKFGGMLVGNTYAVYTHIATGTVDSVLT